MRQRMPARFWADLPETSVIPGLLAAAPARVSEMIEGPASGTFSCQEDEPICSMSAAADRRRRRRDREGAARRSCALLAY